VQSAVDNAALGPMARRGNHIEPSLDEKRISQASGPELDRGFLSGHAGVPGRAPPRRGCPMSSRSLMHRFPCGFPMVSRCPYESLLSDVLEQHRRKPQYSNPGFLPCPHVDGNSPIMRKRVGHNFKFFAVDPHMFGSRIAEMFHPHTDFG